jgi:hypothetical protein
MGGGHGDPVPLTALRSLMDRVSCGCSHHGVDLSSDFSTVWPADCKN